MKRNNKENQFCVEYGMKKLPKYAQNSFNNMFFHKFLVQNEFIDFVYTIIKEYCDKDIDLKNAINYIEQEGLKNNNIAINKNERDDKLQEAYNTIKSKFIEYNILNSSILHKEFRKIVDKKHLIYIHDNMYSYAIDDKINAFIKVYIQGDGYKVSKKQFKEVTSLRSKPELTNESCAIKLVEEDNKYYIILRNSYTPYIDTKIKEYYDENTKNLKIKKDKNGNVSKIRPSYKQIKIRIYYNPKNLLQRYLLENPDKRGSIILVRQLKRGKYRYGIQIAFDGISPVFNGRSKGQYKVSVNQGTEIITVYRPFDGKQKIYELNKNDDKLCEKLIGLNQYLDRSLRAVNPECYKEDGQPLTKLEREKLNLELKKSHRYLIAQKQLNEIYRKLRTKRKTNNYILAKQIQTEFDIGEMWVDKVQIKGWSVRKCRAAEKTKSRLDKTNRNATGYQKHVQERAPAQLTERLKYNVTKLGGNVTTISTFNSTMFNPFTNKNDIFTKLYNRFTRMDLNIEWYLYNEKAVDLLNTLTVVTDEDNNIYYVQRDLFANVKMCFLHKEQVKYINSKGKLKTREVDVFDKAAFMDHFKKVFYPEHIKYMTKLLQEHYSQQELSGTIFGIKLNK